MSFDYLLNDGDEDEILARVQEESLRFFREVELPRLNGESNNADRNSSVDKNESVADIPGNPGTSGIISIDKLDKTPDSTVLCTQVGGRAGTLLFEGDEAKGFHLAAGSSYIYPTNYPIRQYQAAIVRSALFQNTLVSLPTGLGKTFIAAVVMYNFYRWYPRGKVVFMAPTRPLVAQQIKACYSIMGIPPEDTTEMTGIQVADVREKLWNEKRVFFLTPQVMVNDLRSNICPAASVKCIVVDEAHKAVKDYAYCQVIKLLSAANTVYRTLALSATPGNDINAVIQVIRNLNISCLEMRGEDSIDVSPYTHGKSIEHVVVDLSPEVLRVKDDFLQVYERFARSLIENRGITSNIAFLTKFQILKSMEKFRANPPRGMSSTMIGSLVSDFTMCMTLAHALELLQIYGLRAFYRYLADEDGEKSKAAVTRLRNNEDLQRMLRLLHGLLYPKHNAEVPYVWGHPKLKKLVNSLSEHFKSAEDKGEQTKAIVFCNYKVVVNEIVDLLSKCKPLVRATLFVGQSGGKERGMPQAKQLQIMKEFRDGKINCLVATCVAEEGLDIGEVDLIVLMESQKSPVRLVQRLGRTGRKRRGRCIVLLTRGKEESKFHEAMASRKSYVRNIVESKAVKNSLCQYSPPMFPPGTKPQQQLVHIKVVTTPTPTKPAKTGKKQMDIRDCAVTESRPFLDVDAEKQVLEELRGTSLDFKTLPDRMELWYRKSDPPMSVDELLNGKANILSSWNDWNMELQNSFVMSSTTASETLCHLLSYSVTNENENYLKLVENFEKYGELAFEHPKNDQPSKKNAEVADDEKKSKKKNLPKKNYGMDIRSCMATAVEKASKRPKVDLDVSDDDVIIVEPKCNEDIEARIESEKLELNEPPRETGSGLDIAGIFGMNVDEFENVLYGGELLCGLEQNIGMCLRLSKFAGKSACVAPKPKLVDPGVFEFQCDQLLKLMDTVDEIKLEPGYFLKHGTELPEAVITQEVVVESKPVNDSFVDIDDLLGDDVNEVEANCAYGSSNEEKSIKAIPVEEGNIGVISPTEKKSENLSSVWSSHSFFVELSPIGKATKPNSNIISSTPISARVTSKNTDQEIGVADKEDQWLLDDILELDEEVTTNVKKCETLNSSRDLFASTPGAPKSHQKTTVEMKSVNQMNVFKEPRVLQGERKSDEVEEDVWCLDDLFEEGKLHDVTCSGRDAKNETSFYGITQMVSQIERDKIKMIGNACETVEIIDSPVQSPLKNINNSCMPLRSKIVESDCFPVDGEIQKIDSAIPTSRDLPLSQDILSNRVKKPLVQDSVQKDDCIIVIDSDSCGSHSSEPKVQEVLPPVSASQFEKSSIDKEKGAQADRSLLDEDDDVFSVLAAGDFLEKELPEKGRKDNIVQVNVKKFKTKSLFSSLDKQPDNDFAPNQRNSFLEDNSHLKVGGSSKRKLSFEDLLDELDGGTTSKYFARGNPIKAQLNPSIEPSTSTKATKEQTPSLCGSRMETAESSVTKLAKDEDDEDVFIRPRRDGGLIAPFTRSDKSASSSSSPSPLKRVKVKKKSKKKGNVFIEVEAEESGILSADDSDNSSLDEMDDSFVDDESDQEQSYAHYLKSVKSPVVGGKFKIPMNKRYMGNVYSQVVNHEDDNYENDSFCVDSDEEHSGDETTVLERVEKELAKKKKKKKTIKEGPRKRIIKPTDESDCEDVVVNLEDTVAVSGVPKTFKKRFLDSDSDVTPERPALKRPRHRIVSPVENEKCSTAQDQSPPAKREFPAPPGSAKSPIHVDSGSDEELKEAIRLSKLESAKKKTDEERFEEDLQKALLLSQCDVPGPSTMADVPGPSSEAVLPTFTSPGDRGTSLLFMSQPILRDKRPFSTKSKPKSKPEASTNCKRIFELIDGEIQKSDSAIPTSRDLPLSQDILSNRVKKPLVQDSVQKDDCIIVIDSDSCGSHSSEPKVQEVLPPVSASQFEKSSIDKAKGAQADRSLLDEDDDVFSVLAAGDFLEEELPEKGRKDNIVQVNVKKFKTKSLFSSLDKQPDNDFAPNQRNSFLEDNSHLKVGGSSKRKLSFEDLLDELDGGTTSKYFARDNPIKAQLNPSIELSTNTKATKEQTPSLCGSRMETAESGVTKLAKDEDDEDIFIQPRRDGGLIAPFTRSDKSASSSSSPSPLKRVKVKKKSKKKGNVFIEVEAEESGILSADDSDNSSLDEMDDSFVDDESDQEQSYAHYLKSVKSPVVGGKFKIPMNKRYMGNVYSQVVNHEDDSYENDSFCVGSDEEHSGDETTVLERVEKELAKKKKKKKTIKEGPRKRIIKPTDESDCEDVVVNLEDTVAVSGVPKTFKKRFLDSDSDVTPERPVLKRPRHRIDSPVENEKSSTAQDQSPPAKREFPAPPGSAKSPIHVDSGSDEELKEAIRLSKLESAKKKTDEERFEEDLQKALLLSQYDVPGPSTMADVPGPSSEAVLPTFTSPGDRGTSLLFMSQPILRDKRPFSTKSKPKSKPEASTNCKRIFELSDSD